MISPPKNCRLAIATCRFLKVLYKLSATRDIADCQLPIEIFALVPAPFQLAIGNRQSAMSRRSLMVFV
jgi:hypothetical protein